MVMQRAKIHLLNIVTFYTKMYATNAEYTCVAYKKAKSVIR